MQVSVVLCPAKRALLCTKTTVRRINGYLLRVVPSGISNRISRLPVVLQCIILVTVALSASGRVLATRWARRAAVWHWTEMAAALVPEHDLSKARRAHAVLALRKTDVALRDIKANGALGIICNGNVKTTEPKSRDLEPGATVHARRATWATGWPHVILPHGFAHQGVDTSI